MGRAGFRASTGQVRAGLAALTALWVARALPTPADKDAAAADWVPVGLSGGGGMFAPAISPSDPDLMMINCDMGAAYLSEDAGLQCH